MAKICLCLTGKTLARDIEVLQKYQKYVDIAELRADCLDPDERFLIRRFPEMAGLPVILTIRRSLDGGKYVGGEGARITLLSKGLAFAEADRRRNFAYVDLEDDLYVPSLEEAARTYGTRIIRSYHNMNGVDHDLAAKLRELRRVGDELVKAAVMPQSLDDTIRVYQAAKETSDLEKILLCMGDYGVSTRILAEPMGSYLSYTTVKGEPDMPAGASGQLDPRELAEQFHFREITGKTKIFGVTGFPLKVSASPHFFNTVFDIEKTDAVYIPFPADSIHSLIRLAEEIRISGVSVTVPYKESVLPFLFCKSDLVQSIGACNTIVSSADGWMGYNTDAQGFTDSLLEFSGRKDLRGKRVTIVGAGGVSRAVAAEVYRLKGKALILNRTAVRARDVALPYKFAWASLDNKGIEMMEKYADIIIQTTSVGMEPLPDADPIEFYHFTGKELVMDLIYKPAKTRCLVRAEASGCRILNGYDMLIRQARYQYTYFMGKEFPPSLISRVKLQE
ncbi:type I 3-dehydroquinate dehydratase [Leadbettera azotonutricia]|uniref:shikimate dehydrogenase (NADP(+)) n=1 Tax=Leadbettera azotonutricia (strain ATCC BAA-888 / DSM 13862 / ZAS-9) TaxID=545695 RepID=F5Y9W1_LEAAZ|nr:type I 3-dehydroquinate dehydratase [Leadbettera azotonutricia]AEF80497.1 putative 3-dehydroquinate dehydratase, type 1/shikimate 5-dehydrogenase [Leadbettera azotonutricia ZAS-9]